MLRLKDEINTLYECKSQVLVFINKSLIKWIWSSSYAGKTAGLDISHCSRYPENIFCHTMPNTSYCTCINFVSFETKHH